MPLIAVQKKIKYLKRTNETVNEKEKKTLCKTDMLYSVSSDLMAVM